MERRPKRTPVLPLEPKAIGEAALSAGVRIFDIVVTLGDFDAVLLLCARDNAAVAKFLDGLKSWRTVALLATSHSKYESHDAPPSESRSAE
jgi:uncharacterized protein with GYD domain